MGKGNFHSKTPFEVIIGHERKKIPLPWENQNSKVSGLIHNLFANALLCIFVPL